MCTIYTFDARSKADFLKRICRDWESNPDGGSLVAIHRGKVAMRLQTPQKKVLASAIASTSAERFVVHLRAATTMATGVSGCHMFDSPSGEWIYCHNGVIPNPDRLRVDSLALGEDLDRGWSELPDWSRYGFCNVIAVRHGRGDAEVFIHRSMGGTLFTDDEGNWSSKPVNTRFRPVEQGGWHDLSGVLIDSQAG
jgi:hypothetical protein